MGVRVTTTTITVEHDRKLKQVSPNCGQSFISSVKCEGERVT